jgi:hypothetical protein
MQLAAVVVVGVFYSYPPRRRTQAPKPLELSREPLIDVHLVQYLIISLRCMIGTSMSVQLVLPVDSWWHHICINPQQVT